MLITNNEIVRVRYLLAYGSKKPSSMMKLRLNLSPSKDSLTNQQESSLSFFGWCRRNPLVVSAILYVILLAFVGLNQNRSVEHYKNIIKDFLKRRLRFE